MSGVSQSESRPEESAPEISMENWVYTWAERETERVSDRLRAELNNTPLTDFLMRHFGSLLHNAAQRLIDRKRKTGETRARDEALIFSCSRLFIEYFAGYDLLLRGLILPAMVLLRAAFETSTQALLFMEREDMARQWLAGKRIAPKEVRAKSPYAAGQRELYERLSRISHPNLDALVFHTFPVAGQQHVGLAYGGVFAPKAVGQIALQFVFAQLVVLEAFYTIYARDLEEQGLVWKQETVDAVRALGGSDQAPIDWPTYLKVWRGALTDLVQHYNSLPDDGLAISQHLAEVLSKMNDDEAS
ncbi:MAG: hypothetical protein U1B78_04970 [Dehalococcoidia bacterium]|nr:hypothetical protein [Dehalococcoidia bacterium]